MCVWRIEVCRKYTLKIKRSTKEEGQMDYEDGEPHREELIVSSKAIIFSLTLFPTPLLLPSSFSLSHTRKKIQFDDTQIFT